MSLKSCQDRPFRLYRSILLELSILYFLYSQLSSWKHINVLNLLDCLNEYEKWWIPHVGTTDLFISILPFLNFVLNFWFIILFLIHKNLQICNLNSVDKVESFEKMTCWASMVIRANFISHTWVSDTENTYRSPDTFFGFPLFGSISCKVLNQLKLELITNLVIPIM